jgi:hypothetical protein
MNQHNDRVGLWFCVRLIVGAALVLAIFIGVAA